MDIVTHMLPRLRGHVVNRYGWIAERGHCLLTVDDLIQVASIQLMELANVWDDLCAAHDIADDNMAAFMAYLKPRVKNAVYKYSNKVTNDQQAYTYPSINDTGEDGDQSSAEVATSLRVPERFGEHIEWNSIVDFYSLMPKRDKVWVALKYFDGLTRKQMQDVLGMDNSAGLSRVVKRLRMHAISQYATNPVEVETAGARAWEPPVELIAYIRDRHRVDIDEYVGYVILCMRADVSYLVDVLDTRNVFGIGAYADRKLPPQSLPRS